MKIKYSSLSLIMMMLFLFANSLTAVAEPVHTNIAYVESEGWGVAPEYERNPGKARLLARRAAIVDAYRNIGEHISSVRVTAETTVADSMIQSDVIRTNMQTVIQGAVIAGETSYPDGRYCVKMIVPKFGEQSIASAIFAETRTAAPVPFPAPSFETDPGVSQPKTHGAYTGLIVDCSGLGLEPVMSPVIADASGRAIYGHKNLDPDFIIKYGMADYTKKDNPNLARAGDNPLTVRAIGLESHNAKPIISAVDANLILMENQTTNFFEKTAVVFIR